MAKETLAAGYESSQQIISGNIAGISHMESLGQPTLEGNCMNWIAGHLLAARSSILGLLGETPFLGEEEMRPYQRGAPGIKPGDACVDFERLREGLEQTAELIVGKLNSADDAFMEELMDPSAVPVKLEKPTRDAMLTLLLFHEGYHTGQLGIGRRLLGKESVVK